MALVVFFREDPAHPMYIHIHLNEEQGTRVERAPPAPPKNLPRHAALASARDWLPPGSGDTPGHGQPFLGFGGPGGRGPLGQATCCCCSRGCKFNGNRTNLQEKAQETRLSLGLSPPAWVGHSQELPGERDTAQSGEPLNSPSLHLCQGVHPSDAVSPV